MTEAEALIAEAEALRKNAAELASQENVPAHVAIGSVEPVFSWWYTKVLGQTVNRSALAATDLVKTYMRLRNKLRRDAKQ